jgi:hypothetical protein
VQKFTGVPLKYCIYPPHKGWFFFMERLNKY